MAKFYVDFDIDDIMQSIEEELGQAIQEDVESETADMFKRLPSNVLYECSILKFNQ